MGTISFAVHLLQASPEELHAAGMPVPSSDVAEEPITKFSYTPCMNENISTPSSYKGITFDMFIEIQELDIN